MTDLAETPIEIVTYRPEHRAAFERLNREWLEGHGLLEPADLPPLVDPEHHILADGGEVFFALRGGQVVGTCAAIPVSPGVIELAKLTVARDARGAGLGRRLCDVVIDFARSCGARRVVLSSSSKLQAAIRLYERLGFRPQPVPAEVPYQTADIYMTLELTGSGSPPAQSA
jgi:ribosomal protein S18 acetylase RimI-like enzyme